MEACANFKLDNFLLDPMMCIVFSIVLEVKVETRDAVHKQILTLATVPYLPKLHCSRLFPLEISTDYILQEIPVHKTLPLVGGASCVEVIPLEGAKIIFEGIVSEDAQVLKTVEIKEQERQYESQLEKMRRNRRRELDRLGVAQGGAKVQEQEDAAITKVKVEQ